MDWALTLLLLGFAGLLVMAVAGLGDGDASLGDAGNAVGDALPAGHTAGHHGALATHPTGDLASSGSGWLYSFLSLRSLFVICFGAGAAGLTVRAMAPALPSLAHIGIAVAAGLTIEALVARPLFCALLRFAAHPARSLESVVFDEARALTSSDANGHVLVALTLDGETRQILGRLTHAEYAAGVRVAVGDRLRIEEVDGRRQSCTVTRLGGPLPGES